MAQRIIRRISTCYTNMVRSVDKMAKAMAGHCGGGHCS
jgi:hypothetical protein